MEEVGFEENVLFIVLNEVLVIFGEYAESSLQLSYKS